MPKRKILQEDPSYAFGSYFEMPYEPDEILAEFGYALIRDNLVLPQTTRTLEKIADLRQRIDAIRPYISLTSETARRETLVAPILMDVVAYCRCQLRIEYPLSVNNWLKGNLDYLLRTANSLLVIEANDDLTRGFTQLAVELIALAEVEEHDVFYGAVTIGNAWNFGKLKVKQKQIIQDIPLYSIPNDLEMLMKILVGIMAEA